MTPHTLRRGVTGYTIIHQGSLTSVSSLTPLILKMHAGMARYQAVINSAVSAPCPSNGSGDCLVNVSDVLLEEFTRSDRCLPVSFLLAGFKNCRRVKKKTTTSFKSYEPSMTADCFVLRCRVTVTAMCSMDLSRFPLDTQTCSLEIESCEWIISISTKYFTPFSPLLTSDQIAMKLGVSCG